MADAKLISLANQWSKPVVKFKASLINDVHSIIIKSPTPANLELLYYTDYFNKVLWKSFGADGSNSHVELILICLLFKEAPNPEYFEIEDKFDYLLERCLHITYDIRTESNFRLHRLIIQYFTLLNKRGARSEVFSELNGDVSVVTSFPRILMETWLPNLIKKTIEYSYSIKDSDFFEYVRAVVLFLTGIPKRECVYEYNIDMCPGFNLFLKKGIECDDNFFKTLQNDRTEFLRNTDQKVKFLEKPTNYNITQTEAKEYFDLFDIDELEKINKKRINKEQIKTNKKLIVNTKEVLVNMLTIRILGNHFFDFKRIETVVDRFDNAPDFKWCLPKEDDLFDFNQYVYEHLIQVLMRLEISLNKSNNIVINGKSKYFHKISETNTGKVIVDDYKLQGSKYVLLIQLSKPNKYSTLHRVKKYGLKSVELRRVRTVISGNKAIFEFNDVSEFTANYVVSIPDTRLIHLLDYEAPKSKRDLPTVSNPPFKKRKIEQEDVISHIMSEKWSRIRTAPQTLTPVLNKLLKKLHSMNERALIIVPNANYLNIPIDPHRADITSNTETPISKIITNLIERLKSRTNISVDNVTELFTEIERKWNKFLLSVMNNGKINQYPFGELESPTAEEVIKSYSSIKAKIDDIKTLMASNNLPQNMVLEYLKMNYFKFVIRTEEEILTSKIRKFSNVIVIDGHLISNKLKNIATKKLIVFGKKVSANDSVSIYKAGYSYFELKECHVVQEIFDTYTHPDTYSQPDLKCIAETSDLRIPIQIIPVAKTKGQVSVPEAEYAVALYKYMAKTYDVGLVAMNEYQAALLKEVGKTIDIESYQLYGHDYLIVSTFGYNSIKDIIEVLEKAKKGVLFIGEIQEPVKFYKGPLEIKQNGEFTRIYNINDLK